MNNDEHPNDSVLTQALRDSVSELAAPERPPLAAVTSKGRAYRRRRLAGFAGLGASGVAAGAALAFGLTGVLGAAPAHSTGAITTAAPAAGSHTNRTAAARSTGTIRTVAFTLTSNANGTDTLTLTHSQMFDPAALQQALAQDGIPALVKTGSYCVSTPAPPDPVSGGVLSLESPLQPSSGGTAPVPAGQTPGNQNWIADHTVTVINPAAMPPGTELFFGYFNTNALFTGLIYTSSYTCSNGQPPPATS